MKCYPHGTPRNEGNANFFDAFGSKVIRIASSIRVPDVPTCSHTIRQRRSMRVVTAEQMKRIDRRAIERYGIPSLILMENAALAVVSAIEEHYVEAERFAVLCGLGMNGGDGLAVARHLHDHGSVVDVCILGTLEALAGDARVMLDAARGAGVRVMFCESEDTLNGWLAKASTADVVVDALFGTGLTRAPEGLHQDAIDGLNELRLPVVSVDVPSGVNASTGEVAWPAVHADHTITFGLPKVAHVFSPASGFCGEIVVADISIPHAAVDEEEITLSVMTAAEVDEMVPERSPRSHKGTYGHVAIVGGSAGRSGAAVLAARGALRSGAGLVTVVTDRETAQIVDAHSIESMSLADELRDAGNVVELLERYAVVAIGSGLRDDEDSYRFLRELVTRIEKPLVLDAGAISAFAGTPELLHTTSAKILTPHPGEAARLLGRQVSEIERDRISTAREIAARTGAVVILKGHQTLVADAHGNVSVNPTGNPAMAAGGMGDVLTGLAAALLAQHLDAWDAARVAVFLHGLAGDLAASERGELGILASEVADLIPRALRSARE